MSIDYEEALHWLNGYLASGTPSADDHLSYCPDLERPKLIAKKMCEYGLSAWSPTLVARAIGDLGLRRMYDPVEDEAQAAAEDALRRADTTPLTRELGNQLTQMSPSEVARKYYSDPAFKRLYARAAAQWGFKIPAEPAPAAPSVTPIALDAKTYHSLPTSIVVRRYRSEPAFRAAVDKLVAEGQI